MRTGRNDLCVCGSGKKYKRCCFEKEEHPGLGRGNSVLLSVLIALAAIGVVAAWITSRPDAPPEVTAPAAAPRPVATTNAGSTPAVPVAASPVAAAASPASPASPGTAGSPPPGQAPPGKVWSAEHRHYHDAPVQLGGGTPMPQVTMPRPAATTARVPQPPGPAPAGKTWSPEHGHWHDATQPQLPISIGADGKIRTGTTSTPPGPAPPGQVWSPEHGHWHKATKE